MITRSVKQASGNTEVVPFGKYKGQPVEVLQQDEKYMEWLTGQDWFSEKYGNIYNVVINHHGQATETPEHNAMQAKFFDDDICAAVASLVAADWVNEILLSYSRVPATHISYQVIDRKAEHKGVDVYLSFGAKASHGDETLNPFQENLEYLGDKGSVYLELKPSMGDDYPAVLRQIKKAVNQHNLKGYIVLVVGNYTGRGAGWDMVRKIFAADNIICLTMNEIESNKPENGCYRLPDTISNIPINWKKISK